MTLQTTATMLDQLPEDHTIYTADEEPTADSSARVLPRGPIPEGLHYFLEIDLAKEVLEVWSSWRGGRKPTPAEAAAALLHYSKHDAYQPA